MFGRQSSNNGFYSFESFNIPPAIYHYDVATGKTEVFAKPQVPFESSQYEVSQVFYTSKDGTRVPMFISSKKGVKRDGKAPTLMFAYGGFQRQPASSLGPRVRLVDGARGLLRAAQSAGRRRVRRSLAQGGDVREKTECVRRLTSLPRNT